MAIPKFEAFLYPFLFCINKEDVVNINVVKKYIIEYFNLSEDDCARMTKSGSVSILMSRIGWCRQWLRRALFITIPKRGFYQITDRGRKYLETHTSLIQDDLLQYPEYAAYLGVSTLKEKSEHKDENISSAETTPTEQLEQVYQLLLRDLAADLLQKVLEQTPQRFEQIVVDLLLAMGYGSSLDDAGMVTKFSHDDGIDGIIKEDKLGLDKIYIQAKRYAVSNVISKPLIHAFAGALDEKKASKGVFITTSSFSTEARKFAEEKASKKIVLIDGEELARYMIEYNVGVSTRRIIKVKRIDSDYFEDCENS